MTTVLTGNYDYLLLAAFLRRADDQSERTALRTVRIWRDRVAAAITGAMDRADRLFSG
jgi:hypothetical protein